MKGPLQDMDDAKETSHHRVVSRGQKGGLQKVHLYPGPWDL
jgi:hypothetical protein